MRLAAPVTVSEHSRGAVARLRLCATALAAVATLGMAGAVPLAVPAPLPVASATSGAAAGAPAAPPVARPDAVRDEQWQLDELRADAA